MVPHFDILFGCLFLKTHIKNLFSNHCANHNIFLFSFTVLKLLFTLINKNNNLLSFFFSHSVIYLSLSLSLSKPSFTKDPGWCSGGGDVFLGLGRCKMGWVEATEDWWWCKIVFGGWDFAGWWQLVVDFCVDLLVEVDLFWQGWNSMQGGFVDFFLQAMDLLLHQWWWCTAGVVLDCWVGFC